MFGDEEDPIQAGECEEILPFPLFELPPELILHILSFVDERPHQPSNFPSGPDTDLLNLRATSTYFSRHLAPLVWKSINFQPTHHAYLRPKPFLARRGLPALYSLLDGGKEGNPAQLITQLSITSLAFDSLDLHAVVDVIDRLPNLRVLHLTDLTFPNSGQSDRLFHNLSKLQLETVRFNRIEFAKITPLSRLAPFGSMKSLQIMHGSRALLDLVQLSPNLESLLLWPDSRRLGEKLTQEIVSKLPQLRFLSIDAVQGAEAFGVFTREIERLTLDGTTLPLTELFLEGPQRPSERSRLIQALSKTQLKRLALYHLRVAKPELIAEIAAAIPDLEGLTLVQGNTSEAVEWKAPLEAYISELSKLTKLKFFAFDRETPEERPQPPPGNRGRLEFLTLSQIGEKLHSLQEAVAITVDVSEGSEGWFATFGREAGGRTRTKVVKKTVQDFLIAFHRWSLVQC